MNTFLFDSVVMYLCSDKIMLIDCIGCIVNRVRDGFMVRVHIYCKIHVPPVGSSHHCIQIRYMDRI